MKIKIDFKEESVPEYARVLKQARLTKKMTQEDVGKSLGVSAMGMSFFESGKRIPRLDTFERWIDIFDLKLNLDFK